MITHTDTCYDNKSIYKVGDKNEKLLTLNKTDNNKQSTICFICAVH